MAGYRPSSKQRVRLGARQDGTLTLIEQEAWVVTGAYGGGGSIMGGPAKDLYACPNVRTVVWAFRANTDAGRAFRAPGYVEGTFALEGAMDELAAKLGMDPLELRLKNYAPESPSRDIPYTLKGLREAYERGAQRFGWAEREKRRTDRGAVRRRVRRGQPDLGRRRRPAGQRDGQAAARWHRRGAGRRAGPGHRHQDGDRPGGGGGTGLAAGLRCAWWSAIRCPRLLARAAGAASPWPRSRLPCARRPTMPGGSWSSWRRLCSTCPRRARTSLTCARARSSIGPIPDKTIAWREVAAKMGNYMIVGRGARGPNPDDKALNTFGAQFAEVEVNVETGQVRVSKLVAAHAIGRIVNPLTAASQVYGGVTMGLGFAHDRRARRSTRAPACS